jgi:hypothetical protein
MTHDGPWGGIRAFCLFVGYGRSGHSAIGSLIDAHPHAVISHELHAVKRYVDGATRDALFTEIFALAQRQARDGRDSPRAGGGRYRHQLEGQRKAGSGGVLVIGDKKGAGTAWAFARAGLDSIEAFRAFLGVPLKMIHVIRNPFDIVAAGMARGGSRFPHVLPIVAAIRRRSLGEDWLDVHHEDVIADPRRAMTRVLDFLGLPPDAAHLDACEAHVFRAAHQRRFEVAWPDGARERLEETIARYDFLARYSWNS